MASTTSSAFPLATISPCTTDCGDGAGTANSAGNVDADAGAGGSSSSSFTLSTGGMIAIIIVVAIVAIGGSESSLPTRSLPLCMLNGANSCIRDALLCGEEERVEDPRDHPQIGPQSGHCVDAATKRVPEFGEGWSWAWEGWPGEDR